MARHDKAPKPYLYSGEKCYFCREPILPDNPITYYAGPFIVHVRCLTEKYPRTDILPESPHDDSI